MKIRNAALVLACFALATGFTWGKKKEEAPSAQPAAVAQVQQKRAQAARPMAASNQSPEQRAAAIGTLAKLSKENPESLTRLAEALKRKNQLKTQTAN